MKLISLCLVIASLIISFHYVWINRIETIRFNDYSFMILNKWTGNHCIFHPSDSARNDKRVKKEMTNCEVDDYGKIILP